MRIGYARERQAGVTRIVEATRQLLKSEGYVGMTIEAIAQRAAFRGRFAARKVQHSICCEVQAWLHRAHKVGETARTFAL